MLRSSSRSLSAFFTSSPAPELEISNLQIYFTEPPNIDELVYCSYLVRYAKSIDYTISDKVVIRTFDLDFKNGQLQQTTDGFLPLASYPDKQQNPKLYYFWYDNHATLRVHSQ
ncbi:MAG: hypothetical protein IPN33_05725 [Saprospiraceae bacterium]|nr:hypothetical protein [Saprospiraceae bacterium]